MDESLGCTCLEGQLDMLSAWKKHSHRVGEARQRSVIIGLFAVVLLVLPWCLALFPLALRVCMTGALALIGAGVWLAAGWTRFFSGHGDCVRFARLAAWALVTVEACAWISIVSYSAQVSMASPWLLYGGLCVAAVLPVLVTELCYVKQGRCHKWWLLHAMFYTLVFGSLLLARPGRRFHGDGSHSVFSQMATEIETVQDAVRMVHERIAYEPSPFTDTAFDSVVRGTARCGGMANVLDKLLKASGFTSRIVHLEKGSRLHTLVEYYCVETKSWVLADPQHDILGNIENGLSGWDLVRNHASVGIPLPWQGYSTLYIYQPYVGYRLVTDENRQEFYGELTNWFRELD